MLALFQFCRKIPWLFFITIIIGLTTARDNLIYFAIMLLFMSLMLVSMLWNYASVPIVLPRSRVLLWLVLYWLWLIIELLLRPVLSLSIYQFIIQTSFPLIVLVALLQGSWQRNWDSIFLMLALVISVLAIYILVQFFVFHHRPQGFFQEKNLAAVLLNLILWPAVARFLLVSKILARIFWGIIIFLLTYTIALIGTHSAILAALVAYIIFTFCLWERLSRNMLAIISLLLVVAYTLGSVEIFGPNFSHINAIHNAENSRWFVWQETWEMIKFAPIFGHGLGTFASMYPIFRAPADSSAGLFAHNDYLQFFDETGIIGLALFLAIITSFGHLWKNLMRQMKASDSTVLIEVTGLGSALLTLVIQSFFTFGFSILPILLITGVLLARAVYLLANTFQLRIVEINIAQYVRPMFYKGTLIFVSFISIWIAFAISTNYILTLQAEQNMQQKSASDTMYKLVLAQTIWPLEQRTYLALLKLDVQLLQEIPPSLPQWRNLIYQQGINEFEVLHYVNPYNATAFLYRGKLAELNPNEDELINKAQAIYAFQYGLYLNNRDYRIRMAYANLLLKEGKFDIADDLLLSGISFPYMLEPGVLEYYQLTRDVKNKLGDKVAVKTLDQLIMQNRKLLQQ